MSLDPEELGRIIAEEVAKNLGPMIDRMIAVEKRYGTPLKSRESDAITKAAKSRKILTPAERAAILGLRYP